MILLEIEWFAPWWWRGDIVPFSRWWFSYDRQNRSGDYWQHRAIWIRLLGLAARLTLQWPKPERQ